MLEEEIMQNQSNIKDVDTVTSYNNIPYFILDDELSRTSVSEYNAEMNEIVTLYSKYKKGAEFLTEGSNADYIPSDLRFKKAATIINKEARFMFSNPPTFNINIDDVDNSMKEQNAILQDLLDVVLKRNNFNSKISKAIKDCLIGKRVAAVLNFNEDSGITITFLNSMEFIYEFSSEDENKLIRFVCFYNMKVANDKTEQRWFKKTYELENDTVYLTENIYDGLGDLLEKVTERTAIELPYIPAVIILNDGLIGDLKGTSELGYLLDYESYYSKLSNADQDAERKSMNPIRYAIDASQESTSNLSSAPGSFWDIQSDESKSEYSKASVGMMEANMSYSSALKTTLDRIENAMYSEVDVPNITSEQLQGVITSGKTLKALYWGLTTRCNEKMLVWGPAFEFIARTIILGSLLYPNIAKKYTEDKIPDIDYKILVENNYALPEDEESEKTLDIAEVDAKLMSKKAYLKKWRKLNDKEADEELRQIKLEMDLFDNSSMPMNFGYDMNVSGSIDNYNNDQIHQDDEEDNQNNDDNKINDQI